MDYGFIIKDFEEEETLFHNMQNDVILDQCKETRAKLAAIAQTQLEKTKKELYELYENYVMQQEEKKGVKEEIQRLEKEWKELELTRNLHERKSKATSGIQYHNIFKYDKKKINTSGEECECDKDISSCKCTIFENKQCNCV